MRSHLLARQMILVPVPSLALAASGLAQSASAKVTAVHVISATQATVTYDIYLGGKPALSNQTGTAVYQDGT